MHPQCWDSCARNVGIHGTGWLPRDDLQDLFLKQTDPFYRLKSRTSARRKRVEQKKRHH